MSDPGDTTHMQAPPPDGYNARYADGKTAAVHDVQLKLTGDGIEILDGAGALVAVWPHDDVRFVERPAAGRPVRLKNLSQDMARLDVADHAILAELQSLAPTAGNIGARDPIARRKVAFWVVAMFVMFGGGWFALSHSAPVIAAMMPLSMEERIGRTAIEQVTILFGGFDKEPGELTCSGEAGQRALDALVARLKAVDDSEYQFKVSVLDIDIPNAFAAPGGYVVVFDGLLEMAETPDQLAGVLAHEMTHVTHRHATANLVRSIGLQAFIIPLLTGGSMTSDVLNSVGQMAVQASYTRDAEADADRGAVDLMNKAGLKAASFTELLLAIEAQYGGGEETEDKEDSDESVFSMPDMLRSHPSTPDRARLAREAAAPGGEAGLTDTEWQALKSICT